MNISPIRTPDDYKLALKSAQANSVPPVADRCALRCAAPCGGRLA
jgi:hypothetical protein